MADAVAPAFIFVIGLNYGPSLSRRMRHSIPAAYRHFLVRYLALIAIGAIIAAGTTLTGVPTDWGVLQAIGLAGLICLLLIRLPAWARFVIGVLTLCCYQYLLNVSMLAAVQHSVHGGPFGALSWAGLLVLSTAVADVWRKGLRAYAICCAALVVAAGISAVIVPVSKSRVSPSFILIALAISALVFLVVELGSRVAAKRAGILCWWGENPLVLYLLLAYGKGIGGFHEPTKPPRRRTRRVHPGAGATPIWIVTVAGGGLGARRAASCPELDAASGDSHHDALRPATAQQET